jgi:hypothetical protein
MFTNEPPSDDPKFVDGRALTYYDRWTCKYEEGLRRGARAVIIVHTDDTAGYGWGVVRSSWGRETPEVKLAAGEPALAFAGWMSRAAGERLFGLAGTTGDQMHSKIRELDTRNVAAVVPAAIRSLRTKP